MNFKFVDKILILEPFKYACGLKNITKNEAFFYWLPTGQRVLSPAVIAEALGQLVSWLITVSTNFEKRLVIIASDYTKYLGYAQVGDQVILHAKILDINGDVVISTAQAELNNKIILKSEEDRGYMLPLEELENKNDVEIEYKNLYKPQTAENNCLNQNNIGIFIRTSAIAGHHVWESLRYIDGIIEHKPFNIVKVFKNFSKCEPYFLTHFPKKPVVPGVLLMSFMSEACQYLIKKNINEPLRSKALIPTFVKNARFRRFVEPGDQCILNARIISGNPMIDSADIEIDATMLCNQKKVLNAKMGFRTMYSYNSTALKDIYE